MGRINVAVWRAAYPALVSQRLLEGLSAERRSLALRGQMTLPGHAAWIAEAGGEPVAYAAAGPSRDEDAPPGTGEVGALYVLPAWAGRGLGGALLERAEEGLRAGRHVRATLWVLEGNARARSFYERRGWARDGRRRTLTWGADELRVVSYAVELQNGRA
jgi:GNAT superfamily N-acetyltransferase